MVNKVCWWQVINFFQFKSHGRNSNLYERLSISMSAMKIQSFHKGSRGYPILEDADLIVEVDIEHDNKEFLFPDMKVLHGRFTGSNSVQVAVQIPQMALLFNQEQLDLVINLYKQFFNKTDHPRPAEPSTHTAASTKTHILMRTSLLIEQLSISVWEEATKHESDHTHLPHPVEEDEDPIGGIISENAQLR